MKLLEIKNNLVKIGYDSEENLALSSFVALTEENRSYIGQIVNLKADIKSNYAVAKLVFTFSNDGIVDNYDGTIPSMQAELSQLSSKNILSLLPIEKPILLGELAQQNAKVKLDQTIFEKNLVICAEKFENINLIVKNSVSQLEQVNEKSVVIDTDHTFGEFEPIRFKRDFKLPLNYRMIDYIYENDLDEVDSTSKAVIQDIFYEVQEYTKTVDGNFIPFDTFLNVVSQQYESTLIPELALLKNKLLKYQEANVFAQTKEDLQGLQKAILKHSVTYIDIAEAEDSLQKELISYVHSVVDSIDRYIYMFVKLTNQTGDKKILKQVLDNEHVFTTIICSHNYKYLPELKNRAENLIFFAPQTVQHDFASYNTFLSKLNTNEFVVYGALTQNIPLIIELSDFNDDIETEEPEDIAEEAPSIEVSTEENYDFDEFEPDREVEENEAFNMPDNFEEVETFEPVISEIIEEPEVIDEPVVEEIVLDQMTEHDELVEQVAKDVDEIFYTNIAEEVPPIEEVTEPEEETLTEDDLDFISDLPQASYELEQVEEEPVFIQQEVENEELIQEEPFEVQQTVEELPTNFDVEEAQDAEPELPVYPAETPVLTEEVQGFEQGDTVSHPKYGRGVIEKLIKYGNKTLCSISFENVGRRLLDPAISEIEKI